MDESKEQMGEIVLLLTLSRIYSTRMRVKLWKLTLIDPVTISSMDERNDPRSILVFSKTRWENLAKLAPMLKMTWIVLKSKGAFKWGNIEKISGMRINAWLISAFSKAK